MNNFEIIMFVAVSWFWFMIFLSIASAIWFCYCNANPKSGKRIRFYDDRFEPHKYKELSWWVFVTCGSFTTLSFFIMVMVTS